MNKIPRLSRLENKLLLLSHLPLPREMVEEIKNYAFHEIGKKRLDIMEKSFTHFEYKFPSRLKERTTHIRYKGLNCEYCGEYVYMSPKSYFNINNFKIWCNCERRFLEERELYNENIEYDEEYEHDIDKFDKYYDM